MSGLLRAIPSGVLALAVAGAGLSNVLVAQAAENTSPVITSIALGVIREGVVVPAVSANEGDTVRVDVTFTDPDVADLESITVLWADSSPGGFTLTGGERSFFVTRTFLDDFPTNTPLDRIEVTIVVDDGVSEPARGSLAVPLRNVAPVVTSFTVTPAAILDHQSATATGSFVDPGVGDSYTLDLDWGDGLPRAHLDFGSRSPKVFTLSHLYLVGGSFTVTATVTDDDTGVGVATAPIVVSSLNTPPSGLVVTAGPAAEGGTATLTVTFVDPDAADTHTVSLDWGDGALQSLALPAGVTSLSPTHVYQDSGTYNATVKVADNAASTPPVTAAVNVANVAPTVTALNLSASSIVEQESVTAEATFADPGVSDTFTLTIDWGDGTSSSADLAAGTRAGSASHQYLRAGQFVITATVLDRDSARGSMTTMLDVRARNHAPTGLTLTASSPVEGSPATLSGSFTDLDAADAHTVSITWGDGSTGTLPLGAGAATFSATHTYATHGTYHSNVTVTDPAGLAASAAVDVVVQAKTQGGGSTECDLLLALKQRLSQSPWSDHPALRALLERAIAILMAHFGCDDEDGDDGDRSGEHHGDITHAAKTPARDAATKPKPNGEHSGRTGR